MTYDEFEWLEPMRALTKEIEEETKRTREETRQKASTRTMGTVKFVNITRTIDTTKGIHYLDAIDENGTHWSAEMDNKQEAWLVYSRLWTKDPQQPLDL